MDFYSTFVPLARPAKYHSYPGANFLSGQLKSGTTLQYASISTSSGLFIMAGYPTSSLSTKTHSTWPVLAEVLYGV